MNMGDATKASGEKLSNFYSDYLEARFGEEGE